MLKIRGTEAKGGYNVTVVTTLRRIIVWDKYQVVSGHWHVLVNSATTTVAVANKDH